MVMSADRKNWNAANFFFIGALYIPGELIKVEARCAGYSENYLKLELPVGVKINPAVIETITIARLRNNRKGVGAIARVKGGDCDGEEFIGEDLTECACAVRAWLNFNLLLQYAKS